MKPAGILVLLLRALLGAVFIVSGFQKLSSSAANFAAVIEQFQLLQGPAVLALARTLPWMELIFGVFLVLGLWTRVSLLALWAMSTAFIFALGQALLRKLPIEQCGCFGEAASISPSKMFALDAGLWALFLIFFLLYRRVKSPSLDRFLESHG